MPKSARPIAFTDINWPTTFILPWKKKLAVVDSTGNPMIASSHMDAPIVHGLGFASALREVGVGVDGMSVIIPLVSFNLGVETGQLTIASLFLPVIWKLREGPLFLSRGIPACSCGVALLGAYWFFTRTIFS